MVRSLLDGLSHALRGAGTKNQPGVPPSLPQPPTEPVELVWEDEVPEDEDPEERWERERRELDGQYYWRYLRDDE